MECPYFIVVPEHGGRQVVSHPMLTLYCKAAVLTEIMTEGLASDLHILYASS